MSKSSLEIELRDKSGAFSYPKDMIDKVIYDPEDTMWGGVVCIGKKRIRIGPEQLEELREFDPNLLKPKFTAFIKGLPDSPPRPNSIRERLEASQRELEEKKAFED